MMNPEQKSPRDIALEFLKAGKIAEFNAWAESKRTKGVGYWLDLSRVNLKNRMLRCANLGSVEKFIEAR